MRRPEGEELMEEKIKEITIKELKGGRIPSPEENEKFEKSVRKELKWQRTVARIYVYVGFVIIVGCAVRTFAFGQMSTAESAAYGALALFAGGIGLISIRIQMRLRTLYGMFKGGNYVVFDCSVKETKGDIGKATIQAKVITKDGEACDEWFTADTTSARENEKGLPHDFWLLVFPRGKKVVWSKLISDGMVGGE